MFFWLPSYIRDEREGANHSLLVWHLQGLPSGEFPVGNYHPEVITLHHLRGIGCSCGTAACRTTLFILK